MDAHDLDSPALQALAGLRTVVLDVAAAFETYDQQDAMSDFILHLLERGYRLYLCHTGTDAAGPQALQQESFQHPLLTYLTEDMPPPQSLLGAHADLAAPSTLWISDEPVLLEWVRHRDLPTATLATGALSLLPDVVVHTLGELANLLDPTALVLRQISRLVGHLRGQQPAGPLLVGISGPPQSGFQQLAVHLKRELEASGQPLVELLDLAAFLPDSSATAAAEAAVWLNAPAGAWLLEHVLRPAKAGQHVYFEAPPTLAPKDFHPHFPFFISEQSVVVVLAEMLYVPPVRELLHLAVLLEVSPTETARRLYELPDHEPFDAKFTAQYMEKDGGRYRRYLERYAVREGADLRIDGNVPAAFRLLEGAVATN